MGHHLKIDCSILEKPDGVPFEHSKEFKDIGKWSNKKWVCTMLRRPLRKKPVDRNLIHLLKSC